MSIWRLNLGKSGEKTAIEYLRDKGYRILEKNYKSKLGELDIVASDKNTICFVEVKTRSTQDKGDPLEAITKTKQLKLSRLALSYLKLKHLLDKPARFDVVSIYDQGAGPEIRLIKNAFDLDGRYSY